MQTRGAQKGPADAWIDDKGSVRKVVHDTAGGGSGQKARGTVGLHDLRGHLPPPPPAQDSVVDVLHGRGISAVGRMPLGEELAVAMAPSRRKRRARQPGCHSGSGEVGEKGRVLPQQDMTVTYRRGRGNVGGASVPECTSIER